MYFHNNILLKLTPIKYSYWIRINSDSGDEQNWCEPKADQLVKEFTTKEHDSTNNKIELLYDFSALKSRTNVYFEIACVGNKYMLIVLVELKDLQKHTELVNVYYSPQEINAIDMKVYSYHKSGYRSLFKAIFWMVNQNLLIIRYL